MTRSGVGYGGSVGDPSATAPTGWDAAAEADETTPAELPDRRSTVPDTSTPFKARPLAAASDAGLTPARDAIAVRVSPGWTTYEEVVVVVVMLTGTVVLAGAAMPAPDRCSTVPEISTPFRSRPLAEASEAGLTPARAAMPDSVSPGWTT